MANLTVEEANTLLFNTIKELLLQEMNTQGSQPADKADVATVDEYMENQPADKADIDAGEEYIGE